jgi:GNAT superfamily N-acetyltransferase
MSTAGPEAPHPSGIRISVDPAMLDRDWMVAALSERAYWALGRPREVIEASIPGSLIFGPYEPDGRQVGIARVVTDEATFGWVCDVFVDEAARGRGIGTALINAIVVDPRLATCRLVLATRDAEGVYAPHGFEPLRNPGRWMERPQPG